MKISNITISQTIIIYDNSDEGLDFSFIKAKYTNKKIDLVIHFLNQ